MAASEVFVEIFQSGPKWWINQQTDWHCHPATQMNLSPPTSVIPANTCFIYLSILNKWTQVSILSVHKDPVLTTSSIAGHQPILQWGQREREGWSWGCRGRRKKRRGRRGGWCVCLTAQGCRAGGGVSLLPHAVAGGVSVPASHLPNLRLPLLLHQHLPAQHFAGERWEGYKPPGVTLTDHSDQTGQSWYNAKC